MGVLGNETNQAYVYTQDGVDRLTEALPVSNIEWGRSLCELSRAEVTIPSAQCDKALQQVSPLAHSLVVYRGEHRVWEGPIWTMPDGATDLTIRAVDVLGWSQRRPIRAARTVTGSPVVAELVASIQAAFSTHDPNVLAYMQTIGGSGPVVDRDVAAWSGYHEDDFGSIVGLGARFTVLGRRVLTWSEGTVIGSTATLVPEDHLLVDVTVTLDGDSLATEASVRDDSGHVVSTTGGDPLVDPYYGHVGVLASIAGDQSLDTLSRGAESLRAQGYPLPYLIDVPGDAALACDSPFPLEQLVPGVLVPLETTTATGRQVSATFVLSSVKVKQAGGDDEKVSITLVPLTTAVA